MRAEQYGRQSPSKKQQTVELVAAARLGDQWAWHSLVHRYLGLVWAVARAHQLNHYDAADVCQNTWLALTENLTSVRTPENLSAWLATTARREALRVIIARKRETPLADSQLEFFSDRALGAQDIEAQAIEADQQHGLFKAFSALPERCQRMLRLVANAPELSYSQLAKAVGLAPGSIGHTKGRCLAVLRRKTTATHQIRREEQ